MGVHGLWRLIEPSGKPVPLETLENKILAVDVSIWLHQLVKGYQDSKGGSLPNAHLLGIYHRVCKLLYFRIKPVFVFDGGVPSLKRETIAKRHQQKSKTLSEADRIHKNLLSALLKHTAISKVLSEKTKAEITASTSLPKKTTERDNLYVLPANQSLDSTISTEEEGESSQDSSDRAPFYDLHSIDTHSKEFKSLPADMRHDILTDLKETRKQSSWGRLHELPAESDDFSVYQMKRLLKRNSVQTALEEVEKEMGGHSLSLGELEKILEDQGVIGAIKGNVKGNRIASDENTRFLLIKDIKQAVENAKKANEQPTVEKDEEIVKDTCEKEISSNKGAEELNEDLARAIALSLEEESSTSAAVIEEEQPSTSKTEQVNRVGGKGKNRLPLSFLEGFEDVRFDDSESSEEEETVSLKLTPARRYMMEYSGLSLNEIGKIIESKSKGEQKRVAMTSSSKGQNKEVAGDDVVIMEVDNEKSPKVDKSELITVIEERQKVVKEVAGDDVAIVEVDNEKSPKVVKGELITVIEERQEVVEELEQKEDFKKPASVEKEQSAEEVEEMSGSESSNDDFVEVEGGGDNGSPVNAMEVIIKPDEKIEDDLFKDIFGSEEEVKETASTETKVAETKVMLTEKEPEDDRKESDSIQTLKDNIQKFINDFTKPEEGTDASNLSVEQMKEMQQNLAKERAELSEELSTKERLAGNISDQMYQEAQELLELFGVPYLTAPMEAEAQCAFLDLVNLTDGTITDDSDIWLFGGQTVYKNFFNQSKTVLEYKSDSINHHFKLTREQMILLAMLVGSDYTIGLSGVGPVTALEILAAFPPKNHLISGLVEFKSWCKKGKHPGPGRNSLRSKLKNVTFNEAFPSSQVVNAYLEPKVETSKEKFAWSKPDLIGLIDFAKQKFGWTKHKTEEILNPVLAKLNDKRKQKTIIDFYKCDYRVDSGEAEKLMSKRVKTAVDRIGKGGVEDEPEVKKKRVRKEKKDENGSETATTSKNNQEGGETATTSMKSEEGGAPSKKRGRRKKVGEADDEIALLKLTEALSKRRVAEIQREVHKDIEQEKEKKLNVVNLHKREVIPQKQRDKSDMLRNKLKAIETFRKSKQGPGAVKKKGRAVRKPKEDAGYLSEGSSSD